MVLTYMYDDNFASLLINSSTDLAAIEETLHLDKLRNFSLEELQISILDNCLAGYEYRTEDAGTTGVLVTEVEQLLQERRLQFSSLLKTLLQSARRLQKCTFDSGLTANSSYLTFQAIITVLMEAKALKRLDLSYVNVLVCDRAEIESWMRFFHSSKKNTTTTLGTQQSLCQVCLDRCSLVSTPQQRGELEVDTAIPEHSRSTHSIGLDLLILFFAKSFPTLEWLVICAHNFENLQPETLSLLAREAPNLKDLSFRNFDLQADPHLLTFFSSLELESTATLTGAPSQLVRLTLPSTLSLKGAQAVAQYLKQPSASLQVLTLTVNQFVHDDHPTDDDTVNNTDENNHPSSLVLEILTVLANGLQDNRSLESFRLRGSASVDHSGCMPIVSNALKHNYTLRHFSILNPNMTTTMTTVVSSDDNNNNDTTTPPSLSSSDHAANIEMYLKLNRHNRRHLLKKDNASDSTSHEHWLNALIELKEDTDCVFYLLQLNPSLCQNAS